MRFDCSKLDRLTIDDGSEDLSILYARLPVSVDVISLASDLNWVHGVLLEGINQNLLILELDDVFNASLLRALDFAEVEGHRLSIVIKIDLSNSVGHESPH